MMSGINAIPTTKVSKRLKEQDATTIFRCLANNEPPPENLNFKIIRIPRNAMKMAPPSFEYEDGLFLLLRSDNDEPSPVPSALAANVLTDGDLVSLPNCPWTLSGPQGKRTGQQVTHRYCYPRGDPGYSTGRGGAVWSKVDMDGNEDMSCRLLHVYQSKKRAGADISVKSKGVSSRPPKRKGKSVDNGMRKKNKLAGTSGNEMNRGAEHYGGVFPSPCLSHLSIDLGSPYYDFDINLTPMNETLGAKCTPINNMFGAKGTPINHIFGAEGTPAANNNFSFHPIQDVHSSSHGIENMMLNNPAFASAISSVAKSPANNHQQHNAASNGYYYGPFAHARYLSHPPHVGPAYYRDGVKAAPPIPHLPTSNQNALADGGEGKRVILTVTNFSQKLKEIEESLLTDVRSSNSADQVIKLQLLQNWSKAMASKPLQPQSDHALGVAHVSTTNTKAASCEKSLRVASEFRIASTTTQSDANKQVAVKVESPGPSLGSADGSAAAAQSIANTLVALKMEAPDEDTSMITPGSVV